MPQVQDFGAEIKIYLPEKGPQGSETDKEQQVVCPVAHSPALDLKPGHEASTLSFNPTFILEPYIPGAQGLVSISGFLYLSCLSVFLPLSFF